MRFDGKLDKWNDDRGFGFITPVRGGEPVFVHVSAFPRDGRRPQPGEVLSFEVEPAGDGKKRAVRVERPGLRQQRRDREVVAEPAMRRRSPPEGGRRLAGAALAVILALVGGHWIYGRVDAGRGYGVAVVSSPSADVPQAAVITYRCDGRTHCSQMTSCDEAKFFLRNCPGTKMDGDHDGIPCEQQFRNGVSWR